VTAGRAGEAEISAELDQDPTDQGERHAAGCRAAIGDAAHKAAAWQQMAESDELGIETLAEVAKGFGQPEHAELLTPYVQGYFDALPRLWASRGDFFKIGISRAIFPYPAASAGLLEQIDAFLAADEHDPGLVRVVVEIRDTVRRAQRSRARPA
jgi:aminopeptidase N